MGWRDAVHEDGDGCRLMVEVSAGAKRTHFPTAYNPWRQRIGIGVRARAHGGQANQEVLETVAAFFEVPVGAVWLISGQKDARKTLGIALRLAQIRPFLEVHL